MKKLSEGQRMFISVMVIFVLYAVVFILFEDYDRGALIPFQDDSDWHLLLFSLVVMLLLALLLHRYARRMDKRISREQAAKETMARRELTQNIAHEIKTPVASILGFAETLRDNPDLPLPVRQQFVERTHVQATRLTALLQDLSALNRMDFAPEQLQMEPVDVGRIFKDITQEMALQLEKNKVVLENLLPENLPVWGNEQTLYSIFRNLMNNALAYAGAGVTITVQAEQDGKDWLFSFSDNGIGVASRHLPHLFERFYRIDKGRSRSLGGTGLGLSIVKNAVLLHGGTISVTGIKPHGLRFIFTLPTG